MIRDYDIKFFNKEITPFDGLSLFFKMLDKCHFSEHFAQSDIPIWGSTGVIILFNSYWDCLLSYGVVQTALVTWTLYVTILHFVSCLVGHAEPTIGLISDISTNSHKPSTNAYSVNYSVGSSASRILTTILWTLILQS